MPSIISCFLTQWLKGDTIYGDTEHKRKAGYEGVCGVWLCVCGVGSGVCVMCEMCVCGVCEGKRKVYFIYYSLFSYRCVKLETSMRYPTGDIKQALESLSLLLRMGPRPFTSRSYWS